MRIFFSEFGQNYATYSFAYAVYCEMESGDVLDEIYKGGFLPYTGRVDLTKDLFYKARSLRVDLNLHKETSENRRVQRAFAEYEISLQYRPISEVNTKDPAFVEFCCAYAKDRFKNGEMTEDRLAYVMSRSYSTHLLSFFHSDHPVAHVLCCQGEQMVHYWFSFFDTDLMSVGPFGKWVMYRTIIWAKDQGFSHLYLGTCYGSGALYKARDFKGVEFYDGHHWNSDLKLLKSWCKEDSQISGADRLKALSTEELDAKLGTYGL